MCATETSFQLLWSDGVSSGLKLGFAVAYEPSERPLTYRFGAIHADVYPNKTLLR